MEQRTYSIIHSISVFSVAIPMLTYLWNYNRNTPKQNKILAALVVLSAACDVVGYVRGEMGLSNALLFNAQDVFQFLLLAWFYHEVIFKYEKSDLFYIAVMIYVLVFAILSFSIQDVFHYQSWLWSLSGLLLILFAFTYYNYAASKPTHVVINPHLSSELYINGGILVYFSLSLVLFVMVNYIVTELDPFMTRIFWSFHNLNNIIKNIFFAVGLYFTGKRIINITEHQYESIKSRIPLNS